MSYHQLPCHIILYWGRLSILLTRREKWNLILSFLAVTYTLCHKSSFNPCCNVHGFFLVKTFYVSLIYKCRIVLKIFTSPFLSYTTPQRGEISNFINRQTKSAWKYAIKLWILLSQPYTPPETNIYKAKMLLCTTRICILGGKSCIILPQKQPKVVIFYKTDFLDLKYPPEVQVEP